MALTLRTRLTAAFLAVILGPVLLGGVAVAAGVAAVADDRATDRLDLAATAAREAMDSLCRGLHTAAVTAGLAGPAGARQVVTGGLATAVVVADATGTVTVHDGDPPPGRRARCDAANPSGDYRAVAARVELHDAAGAPAGYAEAVRPVDAELFDRLAAASGAAMTLLDPAAAAGPLSTERSDRARRVAAVAGRLRPGGTGQTRDGREVRRLDSSVGQPLPLVLSIARPDPGPLYWLLAGLVVLVAATATAVARWLARTTTRPLAELARAAARVGSGDLAARAPVRTGDELGELAATFNRMAHGMQGYVAALTASRDQLRRHLEVLGDTLSSTHDLDRILAVILRTARAATGARAGTVLLVEDGVLVGDGIRLAVGPGLLGSVAATGAPRRGRIDRDGPELADHEPRCRTYVAVPLTRPGRPGDGPSGDGAGEPGAPVAVRGVLALYDRLGDDEFDDVDLGTLRTFAGQAAIAVENVRLHEEAKRLSHTDALTGLYNYRTLRDSLRREVERASRFDHQLCVLVLDLDRFKEVNDTYGHAAGDAVLVEFARRIRGEIREVDLPFRHGGEEFLLLLPETDAAGGEVVAQRLITATRAAPVLVPGRRRAPAARGTRRQPGDGVPVTVSIGVAVYPDHGSNGSAVLQAADDALYAAKAAGRNAYRIAPAGPGRQRGVDGPRPADGVGDGASGRPHAPRAPHGR